MSESKKVVVAPPLMAKELRQLVASAISDVKAYDVPGFCRRLGLADGTGEEAFSSKFKYAHKRLADVDGARVIEIAREILSENVHFALSEQVAKIDELAGPEVTTLTRRRLIAVFDGRPLCTEIEEIALIRNVWPIASMPAVYQGPGHTLEDDIIRHTIRNDDLSQRELLEALGLLTCSRAQLFRFLEAVTAPDAQKPDEQRVLAEEINRLLLQDGFTLAAAGKISGSPKYAVRLAPRGAPSDETISAALAAFDPNQVHARWTAAMERRSTEPAGAITLARPPGGRVQVDTRRGGGDLARS